MKRPNYAAPGDRVRINPDVRLSVTGRVHMGALPEEFDRDLGGVLGTVVGKEGTYGVRLDDGATAHLFRNEFTVLTALERLSEIQT